MLETDRPRRGWALATLSWLPDPLCLLAAAWGAALLQGGAPPLTGDALATAGFASLLAPFVLRDSDFGAHATARRFAGLAQAHALRFLLLASVVLAAGAVSGALDKAWGAWLLAWAVLAFAATAAVRAAVALALSALQRHGRLAEVVAIVGAGAVAERLQHELGRAPPHAVECLGVFDDRVGPARAAGAAGNLAQLVALGQQRRIDWIVLTLPPTAEQRIGELVRRLKALSAPIGLYSQQVGRDGVAWPPTAPAELPAHAFDEHELRGVGALLSDPAPLHRAAAAAAEGRRDAGDEADAAGQRAPGAGAAGPVHEEAPAGARRFATRDGPLRAAARSKGRSRGAGPPH